MPEPARLDVETDVLVVGAGILGGALAYWLAGDDIEVVLIDMFDANTQASGTNAGSLHVQMTNYFAHDDDPERLALAAKALPIGRMGVKTWRELAPQLDVDIELKVAGGLMVAETAAQMALLERKVELDRKNGIDAEVIGGNETRRIAPYLAPSVIGAEWCAEEGKMNPLTATVALVQGAERRGARVFRHAKLTALKRDGRGFVATTSRGRIRAKRVVNAAGAWVASLARLIGIELPIDWAPMQVNVSEPTTPFMDHLLQHIDVKLTLKQADNGTMIIGGGWPTTVDPATDQPDILRDSVEGNLWIAQRLVPAVGHLRLVRTWGGIMALGDGMPVLGEVEKVPGYYVACCVGYTGGPFAARLLAEALAGRKPSHDIAPFTPNRLAASGTKSGRRGYSWETYRSTDVARRLNVSI